MLLFPKSSLTAAVRLKGGLPDRIGFDLCHSQYCRVDLALSKMWQVQYRVSLVLASSVCLAGRERTYSYSFSYSRRRWNRLAI